MSESDDTEQIQNENRIFVQLLSKYKIIFSKLKSPDVIRGKYKAARAIVNEYNVKCEKRLTVMKLFQKIYRTKIGLNVKSYKNMSSQKQLPYIEWERIFFELWKGKECLPKAGTMNKSKFKTPEEIIMSFTEKYNLLEDDMDTCSENSEGSEIDDPDSKAEPKPEGETTRRNAENEIRAGLISQLKELKALEIAARADQRLKLQKLEILQQKPS